MWGKFTHEKSGDAQIKMNTVVGNEVGDPDSNRGRDLHLT